jgi:hypothetical protein
VDEKNNIRIDAKLQGICHAIVCSVRLCCVLEVGLDLQVVGTICAWHIVLNRCQRSGFRMAARARSTAKVVGKWQYVAS